MKKEKKLNVRVNDKIIRMVEDLRRAEEEIPSKSGMVILLIERAHAALNKDDAE